MGLAALLLHFADAILALVWSGCEGCDDEEVSLSTPGTLDEAGATGVAGNVAIRTGAVAEKQDFSSARGTTDVGPHEDEDDGGSSDGDWGAYYYRHIHPDVMRGRGSYDEDEDYGGSSDDDSGADYWRNIHPDVMRGRGSCSESGQDSCGRDLNSESDMEGPPCDDEEYNQD